MALYDHIGTSYFNYRLPDVRIAKQIHEALGDSNTVLNVGAGTGSYEPTDKKVIAVEPSEVMIKQRPAGSAPVVKATAEKLPFNDAAFDASMAILTIHHWKDWRKGIKELTRVSKLVVILTWDPQFEGFWLTKDYFPEILAIDKMIFPPLDELASMFTEATIQQVPIPHNCTDGFGSAYWRRPEAYLQEGVRNAMSTFAKLQNIEHQLQRLKADLQSGEWHLKNQSILNLEQMDLGYRLMIGKVA